jgi:hypothetical protein
MRQKNGSDSICDPCALSKTGICCRFVSFVGKVMIGIVLVDAQFRRIVFPRSFPPVPFPDFYCWNRNCFLVCQNLGIDCGSVSHKSLERQKQKIFMGRQLFHCNTLHRRLPATLPYRASMVFTAFIVIGTAEYFGSAAFASSDSLAQPNASKLEGYANLLFLAASFLLYMLDAFAPLRQLGKWATWMAGVGAVGSGLALVIRWTETYLLHRPGHLPLNVLYEAMSFFIVAAVVIYLAMERAYRTRAAGPFVMLIVLGTAVYQVWLSAEEQALAGGRVSQIRSGTAWMRSG